MVDTEVAPDTPPAGSKLFLYFFKLRTNCGDSLFFIYLFICLFALCLSSLLVKPRGRSRELETQNVAVAVGGRASVASEAASFSDQQAAFQTFLSRSVFNCRRAATADSPCIVPPSLRVAAVERIDRAVKGRRPLRYQAPAGSGESSLHVQCLAALGLVYKLASLVNSVPAVIFRGHLQHSNI